MRVHPALSLAQLGICRACRLPPPLPGAAMSWCNASGDILFDLHIPIEAQWRFTVPRKQAAGEPGVYLHCYRAGEEGRLWPVQGEERAAMVARLERLAGAAVDV